MWGTTAQGLTGHELVGSEQLFPFTWSCLSQVSFFSAIFISLKFVIIAITMIFIINIIVVIITIISSSSSSRISSSIFFIC